MKATIADVLSQSKLAAQAYARLLHQYPDATLVLRLHAAFAQDVLNDSDFAKALVARAEQLDDWQAANSTPGARGGSKYGDGGESEGESVHGPASPEVPPLLNPHLRAAKALPTNKSTRRPRRKGKRVRGRMLPLQRRRGANRLRTDVTMLVARVQAHLRAGVLALLVLAVMAFIMARLLDASYLHNLDSVAIAADRRTLAVDTVFAARTIAIEATASAASGEAAALNVQRDAALSLAESLRVRTVSLFFERDNFADAYASATTPNVPMHIMSCKYPCVCVGWRGYWTHPGTLGAPFHSLLACSAATSREFEVEHMNTWDAAMTYVAAMARMATSATATLTAAALPSVDWAYVMRNGLCSLIQVSSVVGSSWQHAADD